MADYNKSGTLPINVVFTADDTSTTGHTWKVDGVTATGVTGRTFTKTFTAYKDAYSIEHSVLNSCGNNCSPVTTTKTISITATPQATTPAIPMELVYGLIGVGLLGVVWYSMPKQR